MDARKSTLFTLGEPLLDGPVEDAAPFMVHLFESVFHPSVEVVVLCIVGMEIIHQIFTDML